MKTVPITFRLKGHRQYVHGPDIYNEMVVRLLTFYPSQVSRAFKLTFHSFVTRQCEMVLGEPGEMPVKPEHIRSELISKTDGNDVIAWLIETGGPIKERYEYDEGRIEGLCQITGESIRIAGDSGYSPIEVVTSMTKQLHRHLFHAEGMDWAITRIELDGLLKTEDAHRFSIRFQRNFNKGRLTKSLIYCDEKVNGTIYFSGVNQ